MYRKVLLIIVTVLSFIHTVPVKDVEVQDKKSVVEDSEEAILEKRRRRSNVNVQDINRQDVVEGFELPLDVCGTIPEYDGEICGGSGDPGEVCTRIVGGASSSLGQIPWQVSLYQLKKRKLFVNCGGTLVTRHTAVTASHCLKVDAVVNGEYQYEAWVGRVTSAYDKREKHEKRFIVSKYFKHPGFHKKTLENDIAVLFLTPKDGQSLTWSNFVRPVCLPEPHPHQAHLYDMDNTAIVSGFGLLDEESRNMSPTLQHVKLDIVNHTSCIEAYREHIKISDERNFCAGTDDFDRDSCTGDSGGPLVIRGKDKRYYLAGVVSFGLGCANKGFPGVYTKVDQFVAWVKLVVERIEEEFFARHKPKPCPQCPEPTKCLQTMSCPPPQRCPNCPRTTTCPETCPQCPQPRVCPDLDDVRPKPTSSLVSPTSLPTKPTGVSRSTLVSKPTSITMTTRVTRPSRITRPPPPAIPPQKCFPREEKVEGPVCDAYRRYASCPRGQIIRVILGFYGRVEGSDLCLDEPGLWFQRSFGQLQCLHSDATEVMERNCNGRNSCMVSDNLFQNSHCSELKPYAFMRYSCDSCL